jgi:uncharacterized membrane protein (UPF0127 family)
MTTAASRSISTAVPSRKTALLPALLAFTLAVGCGAGGSSDERPPADQERGGSTPGSLPDPGTAWVIFGTDTVRAEVARTSAERQRGLMYRDEVPAGTGMLFVFPESAVRSFWMQNTYVSLDIAFLDADLRVVDIQQMEARSEDFHESRAPAMFALEVQQGWLAAHGIKIGDRAQVVFNS